MRVDRDIAKKILNAKYFGGAGALQSFFEVPDEEIIKELVSIKYAIILLNIC